MAQSAAMATTINTTNTTNTTTTSSSYPSSSSSSSSSSAAPCPPLPFADKLPSDIPSSTENPQPQWKETPNRHRHDHDHDQHHDHHHDQHHHHHDSPPDTGPSSAHSPNIISPIHHDQNNYPLKNNMHSLPSTHLSLSPPPTTIQDYDYDYDDSSGHRLIRINPTPDQWHDFPALLAFAIKLGARHDGCFKLRLPASLRRPLPRKTPQVLPANAYKARQIRRTTFWQLSTVKADAEFYTPDDVDDDDDDDKHDNYHDGTATHQSLESAFKTLKTMFRKSSGRQLRNVRYRPDIPAWTSQQRHVAGVPADWSPIHPLRGDMLDRTRAIIPGIHTPYVYESAAHFGAAFQMHAEDYRLLSLNHLYRGRKIWVVVPGTAVELAERALRQHQGPKPSHDDDEKNKAEEEKDDHDHDHDWCCSQFMRHRAEFIFPAQLDRLGVPYRLVDQRAGETVVVLTDAYHEGFSTGYTLAEARNYADSGWDWAAARYRPCVPARCRLMTAIPAEFMRVLAEGEERLDLCALSEGGEEGGGEEGEGGGIGVLNGSADEESCAKRVKVG